MSGIGKRDLKCGDSNAFTIEVYSGCEAIGLGMVLQEKTSMIQATYTPEI